MTIKRFLLVCLILGTAISKVLADEVTTVGYVGEIFYAQSGDDKIAFIIKNNQNGSLTCWATRGDADKLSGEVTIPASVTYKQGNVGYTFKVEGVQTMSKNGGNQNVTSYVVSEGITVITNKAFSSSNILTSVSLPASVTSIDENCFTLCPKLTTITVADGNANYKTVDGVLFSKDGKNLVKYPAALPNVTEYTVPTGTEQIIGGAIDNCQTLKTLTVSASVDSISYDAIATNRLLTLISVDKNNQKYSTVDSLLCNKKGDVLIHFPTGKNNTNADPAGVVNYKLPDAITTIAMKAFVGDPFIQTVNLNKVHNIEPFAFQDCGSLRTVNIPKETTFIAEAAFYRCSSIEAYNVEEGNPNYSSADGVLMQKDGTDLILHTYPVAKATEDYVVPDNVTKIAKRAFGNAKFKTLTIGTGVKEIGDNAANDCPNLTTVTFKKPSQVEVLPDHGFAFNPNLETFTFPSSVKETKNFLFDADPKLTTVTIPENSALEKIGYGTFKGPNNITTINLENAKNLTTIGGSAFQGAGKLTAITIPNKVTTIDGNAFAECNSLAKVTFAEGSTIETIKSAAFANCHALESIDLPASVKEVQAQAFLSCEKLATVHIPAATTNVSSMAFALCSGMQTFTVDAGNTAYSTLDGMLTDKDRKKLVIFPNGRAGSDYTLLPTINTVGSNSFYNCNNLTNVALPKDVTTIETSAFAGCTNLRTVTCFGTTAPTLGDEAFKQSIPDGAGTLYYRRKDATAYAQWGGSTFGKRIPSFNARFTEQARASETDQDIVEYLPLSDNACAVVSNAKAINPDITENQSTKTTLVIPVKVYAPTTEDGTGMSTGETTETGYNVKMVYDDAFTKNSSLTTLTFLGDITYIGTNAFRSDAALKDIFFVGTDSYDPSQIVLSEKKYELKDNYRAFDTSSQHIYVKPSKLEAFKTAVTLSEGEDYASIVATEIPVKVNNTANKLGQHLATLCREFAVDFNNSTIKPYAPRYYHKASKSDLQQYKDYEGYVVSSDNDQVVPAFSGMILYAPDGQTSYESTYTIAETQTSTETTDNWLHGVWEDTNVKKTPEEGYTNYGMSVGVFHPYKQDGTVKAFRSYITLADKDTGYGSTTGAKGIVFIFDDNNGGTTAITGITTADTDKGDYYTLQGLRVAHPTSGIYIHNGKKVIIK